MEAPHWQEASSHSAVRRSRAGLAAWACPSAARAPASPARSSSCRELGAPHLRHAVARTGCATSRACRTVPGRRRPPPRPDRSAAIARRGPPHTPHWETQLSRRGAEEAQSRRGRASGCLIARSAPRYAAAPRERGAGAPCYSPPRQPRPTATHGAQVARHDIRRAPRETGVEAVRPSRLRWQAREGSALAGRPCLRAGGAATGQRRAAPRAARGRRACGPADTRESRQPGRAAPSHPRQPARRAASSGASRPLRGL